MWSSKYHMLSAAWSISSLKVFRWYNGAVQALVNLYFMIRKTQSNQEFFMKPIYCSHRNSFHPNELEPNYTECCLWKEKYFLSHKRFRFRTLLGRYQSPPNKLNHMWFSMKHGHLRCLICFSRSTKVYEDPMISIDFTFHVASSLNTWKPLAAAKRAWNIIDSIGASDTTYIFMGCDLWDGELMKPKNMIQGFWWIKIGCGNIFVFFYFFGGWWLPLIFPKVPQSSLTEFLGFPSYHLPLKTPPLRNLQNTKEQLEVLQLWGQSSPRHVIIANI